MNLKNFEYNNENIIFKKGGDHPNTYVYNYKGIEVYSFVYNINEYKDYIKKIIDRALNPALITKTKNNKYIYINRVASEIAKLL